MSKTHKLRPQEAVDLGNRIRNAIQAVNLWASSIQKLDIMSEQAAHLEDVSTLLALTKACDKIERNPPQAAIETLSQIKELFQQIDEIDAKSETVEVNTKTELH